MILASQVNLIQERVDRINVPAVICWIPTKFLSEYAVFTADQ